jgi:hypothetical protein
MDEAAEAFSILDNQCGLLVFVNGEIVGMDVLSSPLAYAKLHGKLVRSHVMDAVVSQKKPKQIKSATASKKAKAFFELLQSIEEKSFDSVGLGADYRYRAERTVGSALVADDCPAHAAFFKIDEDQLDGRMAGGSTRARYRAY